MKDDRFLPVDEREPMDDFDDFLESEDKTLDNDSEAGDAQLYPNGRKLGRDTLYIAS